MSSDNVQRRVAFVTGASQGLGAAIAIALAREGFDVAAASTKVASLASTLKAIEAAGRRAVAVALNLAEVSSVESAIAAATALGPLDVLVNNAGITLRRSALEMTPDEWDSILAVNLKGTFFLTQQMGRHLVAAKRPGCVINMASTHGLLGFPQRLAYGVSKAGLMHMTRMLAIEWAQHGIRVNAIAPGTVSTPSREAHFSADPAAREAMIARVPLKRFATMEEVAAAVCYLASPAAQYVTGQTLILDGGLTVY